MSPQPEGSATEAPETDAYPGRRGVVALLALSTFFAMSAWFSTTAVAPALSADRGYTGTEITWMAVAVQAGFVLGTFLVAVLNLPDIVQPQKVYLAGTAGAGLAAFALLPFESAETAVGTRFLLGLFLAAVYPVGMKLLSGWYQRGRGLVLGIMIGALTLGSGLPHLFRSVTTESWEPTIAAAAIATFAGGIVTFLFVPQGPFAAPAAPFRPRYALDVLRGRSTALAVGGYLGHMWELYAMWTWVPLFLAHVIGDRETLSGTLALASVATFLVFLFGAAGCVTFGVISERWGRSRSAAAAMIGSGSVALVVGFLPSGASILIVALVLIWGFTVIADSAQFSTAMSELAEPSYVGSALTIQTGLGFLITIASIRLVPVVEDAAGWGVAFAMLAAGPALGTVAMLRLRRLPEAARMASGLR